MVQLSAKLLSGTTLQLAGEGAIKHQDEVSAMLRLHSQGWSIHKLSREFSMSRVTVRKYLRNGGVVKYNLTDKRVFQGALRGHEDWLREKFFQHGGNADVIRQELESEKGIAVSLRTVERAVQAHREILRREALATVRFETPPGRQMQIDFGEKRVLIGGTEVKVHFFVSKLGYSRRLYVKAFEHENQQAWFQGMEDSFAYFGGVPAEVLTDNPRALVTEHNPRTRELLLNEKFKAFADYWGFSPRACAPFRARTKGKVENGVRYVKRNCIAGREFSSWSDMERHIANWLRTESDGRVLTDASDTPLCRFESTERAALRPAHGRPPFVQVREYVRKVPSDAHVVVDTNRYSVPWAAIGKRVQVQVTEAEVVIYQSDGTELARHVLQPGTHQKSTDKEHLRGIMYCGGEGESSSLRMVTTDSLSRPLSEYEEAVQAS